MKIFNYGGIVQSISFPTRRGHRPSHSGLLLRAFRTTWTTARRPCRQGYGAGVWTSELCRPLREPHRLRRFTTRRDQYEVPLTTARTPCTAGHGFDQKIWAPAHVFEVPDSVSLDLLRESSMEGMGFPGASGRRDLPPRRRDRLTLSISATSSADTVVNLDQPRLLEPRRRGLGNYPRPVLYINAATSRPSMRLF